MHHTALNIPDLFLPLWRAKVKKRSAAEMATWRFATLRDDDVWKEHGKIVESYTRYWPGSFDRTPRNPAEKLNSGYKAWEFMLYFYGIGPGVFWDYIPEDYYKNYCLLVRIVRTMIKHKITLEEVRQSLVVRYLLILAL